MGSYIERSLRDGENVKYEAYVSLWSLLPGFITGVIALGASFFSMLAVTSRINSLDIGAILSLVFAAIGIMTLVRTLAVYYTTELAITNRRVLAKTGWIARDSIELLLHKVESVQTIQQPSHRMLNYGTVVVSGAGEENAVIKGISDPLKFRDHYNEAEEDRVTKANQSIDQQAAAV